MITKRIFFLFITWRCLQFVVAFFATLVIKDFGARFPYYHELLINTNLPPWIWGFGNFDGVHYITIAERGYSAQFTQSFFPLYPLLIRLLTPDKLYFLTGLLLSNLLYLGSLFLIYKLFELDYNSSTSLKSIILILAFPTSFYFGAVYSESLFIFLVAGTLLLIRNKKFLLAGILAALASGTRILGFFLIPVMFIEIYQTFKKNDINMKNKAFIKSLFGVFIAPLGLIFYMIYLKLNFNDPLFFLSSQPFFGAGRSDKPFILLPQVLYRYFKIIKTIQIMSLSFFNALLELLFTIAPLIIIIRFFKGVRLSYLVFTLGCIVLPTLTGTLSSMPRYALMSFLMAPLVVQKSGKSYIAIVALFIILQVILLSLFIRGYWVA